MRVSVRVKLLATHVVAALASLLVALALAAAIEIRGTRAGDCIALGVSNSGTGVPEEPQVLQLPA